MAASSDRGSSSASRWPLAGVRVLEIGSEIAVTYATKLIADAGADGIKLEPGEAGAPLEDGSIPFRSGSLTSSTSRSSTSRMSSILLTTPPPSLL